MLRDVVVNGGGVVVGAGGACGVGVGVGIGLGVGGVWSVVCLCVLNCLL